MAEFPKDQFDDLPDDLERVGAHRAPARRGRGWIALGWAALATGVLVAVGLFALSRLGAGIDLELPGAGGSSATPVPTPSSTVAPITDPSTIDQARQATITVLNGTATEGLQTEVTTILQTAGWPVGSALPASSTDVQMSAVYYSDPLNEDIARGVALELGIERVLLDEQFAATATVVLGADYTAG